MTATPTATATARTLAQRLEFAPPKTRGILPSALLAVLAHLALLAALTWGVQWKQQVESPVIDAELWSSVPVLAAPKLLEQSLPEPVPQPPPLPEPLVQKRLAPPPPPPPPASVAEVKDAQIALEREKKREKRKAEELALEQQAERATEQKRLDKIKTREEEKQALAKAEALEKLEKEKLAKKKLAQEQEAQDKKLAEKKLAEKEKATKREAEQRLADEQALKTANAKTSQAAKTEAAADREKQMQRMMGMAAGSGDANATGTAQKPSGPSASYGGRVAAKIKGNIIFPDDIPGNPMTDIEFRTSPDGSILGTPRIVKSSGTKAWDEAVVNAIIKTETLPRDTDGRIPPVFSMGFRPKDLGLK